MNKFAKRGMWESEYRPEQTFARDFISTLKTDWIIKTEYVTPNLMVDGKAWRKCTLDIAVVSPIKIAIRLNGGYHFSSGSQQNKDEFQKEALKQAGWIVVDFNSFNMPNLFGEKNKETVILAEKEIIDQLGKMSCM